MDGAEMDKFTQMPSVAGPMSGLLVLGRLFHLMSLPAGRRTPPTTKAQIRFPAFVKAREVARE